MRDKTNKALPRVSCYSELGVAFRQQSELCQWCPIIITVSLVGRANKNTKGFVPRDIDCDGDTHGHYVHNCLPCSGNWLATCRNVGRSAVSTVQITDVGANSDSCCNLHGSHSPDPMITTGVGFNVLYIFYQQ